MRGALYPGDARSRHGSESHISAFHQYRISSWAGTGLSGRRRQHRIRGLGFGSGGEDRGESAVEGDAQLVGVASDLGEKQAALHSGERALGERAGVGVGSQLAAGCHALESFADRGLPAVEAVGEFETGAIVVLGELAGERADRTAALRATCMLEGHERVGPGT